MPSGPDPVVMAVRAGSDHGPLVPTGSFGLSATPSRSVRHGQPSGGGLPRASPPVMRRCRAPRGAASSDVRRCAARRLRIGSLQERSLMGRSRKLLSLAHRSAWYQAGAVVFWLALLAADPAGLWIAAAMPGKATSFPRGRSPSCGSRATPPSPRTRCGASCSAAPASRSTSKKSRPISRACTPPSGSPKCRRVTTKLRPIATSSSWFSGYARCP